MRAKACPLSVALRTLTAPEFAGHRPHVNYMFPLRARLSIVVIKLPEFHNRVSVWFKSLMRSNVYGRRAFPASGAELRR